MLIAERQPSLINRVSGDMSRRWRFTSKAEMILETYHPYGIERITSHYLPRGLFA